MDEKIRKAKAIEKKNKEILLRHNTQLNDNSGIYFLTRVDENGIRYAYIGQAQHVLTRMAQHMIGYQHIDLSLKKHGLYTEDNPYGWVINLLNFPTNMLDAMEQKYIKVYANNGYQLRNKTAGGQGEGKVQIDEFRPSKTYRDGVKQGRITLGRELKHIIEKHLVVELKETKKENKTSQKALKKFFDLLEE